MEFDDVNFDDIEARLAAQEEKRDAEQKAIPAVSECESGACAI